MRPMARRPLGERKDAHSHSTPPSRDELTTTVSSTSSFRRRRRRRGRLLGSTRRGRQAAGRGSTLIGAGCAARRAASAPSSARAACVSVGRCAGTSWPDLGVRAHLLRSARASRRAAKGARRSMANGEIVGSRSVLRCAWSRPQRGGGSAAFTASRRPRRRV